MLIELCHPTQQECNADEWVYSKKGFVLVIDNASYYWKYFPNLTSALVELCSPDSTWIHACYDQTFEGTKRQHTFSNPVFSCTVDSIDDIPRLYPEYLI